VPLAPVPPEPAFDARLIDLSGKKPPVQRASQVDLRRYTTAAQSDTFMVAVQGLYPITLSWSADLSKYCGVLVLESATGRARPTTDMRSVTRTIIRDKNESTRRIIMQRPTSLQWSSGDER
jgi:hypothetical protein